MVARLFQIVYLLMERDSMTAKELADKLEVSVRTINRDIEKLSEARIPIYATRGRGGGISLLSDFVLNKKVLTEEEKSSILSSMKVLGTVAYDDEKQALSRLEDFFGDMDFKVTGTTEGITAIQMDIKIHGLTRPIVEGAIARCREARLFIMDTCMKPAISEPRKEVGKYAPKIIQMQIDPQKIGDVVGQRGKTINALIERTDVKIDITDDGNVSICGEDADKMAEAKRLIEVITTDYYEGQILEGEVISIKEFGAFIEFAPGKEGMVHISKIAKERIEHVEDVLTLGDHVKVVCLGKDKMGRMSFSIKDVKEN